MRRSCSRVAPWRWATTCAWSAASWRASCAICWCCPSIPSRASDPEIAGEAERDRLLDLAKRFSREDLLRSFDLLTRAESDIRSAAQPRYHLEMALLRWIHQRKLVAIEDLIQSAGSGQALAAAARLGAIARCCGAAASLRRARGSWPRRRHPAGSCRLHPHVRRLDRRRAGPRAHRHAPRTVRRGCRADGSRPCRLPRASAGRRCGMRCSPRRASRTRCCTTPCWSRRRSSRCSAIG